MEDHHRPDSREDNSAPDQSKPGLPSFNSDGTQLEDIFQWASTTFDGLKRSIEELKSEFSGNHQSLVDLIKDLEDRADELNSLHRSTMKGSLLGWSIAAAGGITSIAGLALAPFTLGTSLALTGVGVTAGVAGGATGATFNITNMIQQKHLRQTMEKILSDLQNTIKPMIQHLSTIHKITEDVELVEQSMNTLEFQRTARGIVDILKSAKVGDVALVGKICAEAAEELHVYVRAVGAVRGTTRAAKAVRATTDTATAARTTTAAAGALSALLRALDVYCIIQDSTELSEMNQPADERKADQIKSETFKFILQMKETALQFKKIVDKIEETIDTLWGCVA